MPLSTEAQERAVWLRRPAILLLEYFDARALRDSNGIEPVVPRSAASALKSLLATASQPGVVARGQVGPETDIELATQVLAATPSVEGLGTDELADERLGAYFSLVDLLLTTPAALDESGAVWETAQEFCDFLRALLALGAGSAPSAIPMCM